MKRNHGFTLVELLVVIGIIALLISILLPALGRVRWQAKTTACSARMRDVVLAVQMYANDNKGYLPPYGGDTGSTWGGFPIGYGTAASINVAYQQTFNFHPTNTVAWDDGAQMGRLYRTKYLKTTKTFFCPSAYADYLPANLDRNFRNFANYVLNPHVAYRDANTTAPAIYKPWWNRLPNYGRYNPVQNCVPGQGGPPTLMTLPSFRRAILTDPLYGASPDDRRYITHAIGTRRAFNFAYPDGSVQTYTDNNWAARVIDRWNRFCDLSNALQHNLDGGTVNFASGTWVNGLYNAIPVNPQ